MPDQIIQAARDFWGVIAGIVGLAAWLLRLESRAKSNTKDILRLERELERERQEMQAMLKEIRGDIKTLLQRRVD